MRVATRLRNRLGWCRWTACFWSITAVLFIGETFLASTVFAQEDGIYDCVFPGEVRATRMWLPDNVETVKGILIVGNPMRSDARVAAYQDHYRRFAEAYNFVVIGTCEWDGGIDDWEEHLAWYADASGHPEIVNAPWAPVGFSHGGGMACDFNIERPEKVIAFFANKGGWPDGPSGETLKTPGIFVVGELETYGDTSYAAFVASRQRGALWAWGEEPRMWHSGYVERLMLTSLGEAIRLRYPADQAPTATSGVMLRELNEEDGWLVDVSPSSPVSELMEMASYEYYTGDIDSAGWLLNEGMANVFRAFAVHDKKVSLVNFSNIGLVDTLPGEITLQVNTSAVPDWSKVELFDYDTPIATVLSGGTPSNVVSLSATLRRRGVHGIFALVTEADGETFWTTDVTAYIATPEPSGPVLLAIGVLGICVLAGCRRRRLRDLGFVPVRRNEVEA